MVVFKLIWHCHIDSFEKGTPLNQTSILIFQNDLNIPGTCKQVATRGHTTSWSERWLCCRITLQRQLPQSCITKNGWRGRGITIISQQSRGQPRKWEMKTLFIWIHPAIVQTECAGTRNLLLVYLFYHLSHRYSLRKENFGQAEICFIVLSWTEIQTYTLYFIHILYSVCNFV